MNIRAGLAALVGCAVTALSAPSHALDEAVVFDTIVAHLEDGMACETGDGPFWSRHVATNPQDGYRPRFSRFGCAPGPRGSVVIAPGRTEASVEYFETAIDLSARGFGPVYVVDHRGQGLSPRLLPDPHKGHVERFEDYIDDFEAVLDAIRGDLEMMEGGAAVPLYFASNSMGGAIGLGYLQRVGDDSPFAAAALLGPMLHANYLGFTGRSPTWLNLRLYSEAGALMMARLRCGLGRLWDPDGCTDYASPATFAAYRPETRVFRKDDPAMMTHSRARFDLRTHLWDGYDWSDIAETEYRHDEAWSGPQLGGSTSAWVREAARFNRKMRRDRSLARLGATPVLILTGTEDLRAWRPYPAWRGRAPDLSHHADFCNAANRVSVDRGGGFVCLFVPLRGGFHELLKERDAERRRALDTIDWYFRLHAP